MSSKNKYIIILITSILIIYILLNLMFNTIPKKVSGISNYDKNNYLKEYKDDLDSNLSIFPDKNLNFVKAKFKSSFQSNLFDNDGYIILKTNYNKEDFNNEINRLNELKQTIKSTCNKKYKEYTNYIKYDTKSYKYPAYISIDGFAYTYEYALINKKELEIIYIYLSYPDINNNTYKKYLKKDKSYYKKNTINMYSMYSHSFDNNKSFVEVGDCN